VDIDKPTLAPGLKELRDMFEEIQKKAFELFEHRGSDPGKELDQAELAETDAEFRIEVGVPGLEAKDTKVTAEPNAILVQAHAEKYSEKRSKNVYYSEFGEKSLYRRFDLAAPIDLDRVSAKVDKGLLTVIAPKKALATPEKKEEKKKVAVAA
jgi:HSP20 family protein